MKQHQHPLLPPLPKMRPFPAIGELNEWGNIILSARGWYGQYRIKSWMTAKEAFVPTFPSECWPLFPVLC